MDEVYMYVSQYSEDKRTRTRTRTNLTGTMARASEGLQQARVEHQRTDRRMGKQVRQVTMVYSSRNFSPSRSPSRSG